MHNSGSTSLPDKKSNMGQLFSHEESIYEIFKTLAWIKKRDEWMDKWTTWQQYAPGGIKTWQCANGTDFESSLNGLVVQSSNSLS